MKENYKGLDVDLSNFLIISPNGHNGDNAVATEQPRLALQFLKGKNQVLFNYDGKIFKCTTISSFDDNNALGQLNFSTGAIHWHKGKITDWYKELQPEYCKNCVWFPSCLGICNRQLLAHQGEHICTFDAFNLTRKEYLMYLFKYNILQNEISY